MRFLLCYLFFFISYAQAETVSDFKPWTRAKDNKTILASFVSFDDQVDVVTLKLKNGKTVKVDASVLIPEHRSRLEDLKRKKELKKETGSKPLMESVTPKKGGPKIHIYKPAGYADVASTDKSRPIAFLYAASGNSIRIVDRLKPAADELGWILVGVDAYSNVKVQKSRAEVMGNTQIAFNWAKKNISFDSNKIVFGGMSGGGWWSYQSASAITKKTAGILAFGGWMSKMYDQKYSRRMAVALVNGDKDEGALLYEEKDTAFLVKRTRAKVKTFRFSGGHVLAPSDTALEAARWIHKTKEF